MTLRRYMPLALAAVSFAQTSRFPSNLRSYLDLSDTQAAIILQRNAEFDQSLNVRLRRIDDIQREIAAETRNEQLDPMAIGLRYASVEQLNRESREEFTALRARLHAELSAAQNARLAELDAIRRLAPIAYEAVCGNLLAPAGTPVPAACLFPALEEFLTLTQAQTSTVRENNAAYARAASDAEVRIFTLSAEIDAATAKPALDPFAIGSLYAGIEQIKRDLRARMASIRERNRALLTEAQTAKLKTLEDERAFEPVAAAAISMYLLDPLPNQWFDTNEFR